MRKLLLALICSLSLSGVVFAQHKDVAPIPDEVIERVVKQRIGRADPLLAGLQQQLRETDRLLVQAGEAGRKGEGLSPGLAMQISGKSKEMGVLRQMIKDRLLAMKPSSRGRGKPGGYGKDSESDPPARILTEIQALQSELEKFGAGKVRADIALPGLRKSVRGLDAAAADAEATQLSPMPTIRTEYSHPSIAFPSSVRQPVYLAQRRSDEPNLYAFSGDNAFLAVAPPATPSEASACVYDAADLAATEDAPIDGEIRALAESLGYSPAKIYQYVYEQIVYEPYYGSLKGAKGVLYSKAGGATDQASLLIALLRASNIPARYVRGTIGVADLTPQTDGGRVGRWLGAKSYAGAKGILMGGRFPTIGDATVTGGSTAYGVALSHVWVEACVPYAHYRGAKLDNSGHRWIPLDPSFKEKSYQPGIAGVSTNVTFDYAGFMATRTQQLPLERFEDQVEGYIRGVAPRFGDNTLEDVAYSGKTQRRRVDVLPATLPYEIVDFTQWGEGNTTAEAKTLPDRHRYKLNIAVNGISLSSTPLSLPKTALSRLTLSFKGATGTDQTNLDAWRTNGNISTTPPCGINVVPVLKVEGVAQTPASTPSAVGLCSFANQLLMDLTLAEVASGVSASDPLNNGRINSVNFSNIKAASYHALHASAFQTSDRLLTERAARLLKSVHDIADLNSNLEETEGEFLHLVGLKFERYIDDSFHRIGELNGDTGLTGMHLGVTASQMKVEHLYDIPFAITQKGFLIDFPGLISRSADRTTGRPNYKDFILCGYAGSNYESYVWQENAKADAVSTVRGIQYAREKGIEVLILNSTNWSANNGKLKTNTDSTLNYTDDQISSLFNNYISKGFTVTIPRSLIRYTNDGIDQWKGHVYLAEKDNTSDPANPAASATFAINEAAGGIMVGGSQPPVWSPILDMGYLYDVWPFLSGDPFPASFISNAQGTGLSPYAAYGADPVSLVTGNVYHVERDIRIKGRGGLDIVFERSYNSLDPKDGPLGFGWTHGFNQVLEFTDDNANGITEAADTDGITSSVLWTDGTGAKKYSRVNGTAGGVAIGAPFTAPTGFYQQFKRNADGTYSIRESNGMTYTFESVAGTVGQKAKLLSIQDRNGNKLTLGYASGKLTQVTDDLGRSLTITYGGARISEVRDWTGRRFRYDYDAAGNLAAFRNPLAAAGAQNPVAYTYYSASDGPRIDHALRQYTLPRGNGMTFEYYANGRAFRQFTTAGETTTFSYNDFRRETIVTNPRGHERHYFFDKYGNPVRVVEENGAEREYTFAAANPYLRTIAKDPMDRATATAYDEASGNVTRNTLPSGLTVEYSNYNAFGRPGKLKDPKGNYTLLKYDTKGNLLQEIRLKSGYGAAVDPVSYTPAPAEIAAWTINTYDAWGNVTSTKRVRDFATQAGPHFDVVYNDTVNNIQGLNAVSLSRYGDKDGNGSVDAPDTASQSFDALGRITQGITGDWYTANYQYDNVDRVIRATDPVGQMRDFRFDANGNRIEQALFAYGSYTSGKLDGTSAAYDISDRQERSLDAGGNLTRYEYDAAGNLIRQVNPDNYSLTVEYDAAERAVAAYDQEGNRVSTERDLDGRPRSVTDPNGNTTNYFYWDATRDGRLKRVEQPRNVALPASRAAEYDYDSNGNVTQITDYPADYPSSPARTVLKTYDELNRLVRAAGPAHTDATLGTIRQVTRYAYDNLGKLTQVSAGRTDASGTNPASDVVAVQATYLYDDFGRKLRETDPLARSKNWTYDVNGNVLTQIDAKSQTTSFTWGYGHQLMARASHGGLAGNLTYNRNSLGRVTSIVNTLPAMTTTFAYDAAGRLKGVTDSRGNKTLSYDWSPGGLLNKMSDSEGNQTSYRYDNTGRLKTIYPPNGEAITFTWDAGGRLTQKWFPNGIATDYRWNGDNTLAVLNNFIVSGQTITQQTYTYDGYGRRSTDQEKVYEDVPGYAAQHNWRYVYDPLDRLKETYIATGGPESLYASHRYDVWNNMLRESYGNGNYFQYTYDAAHQHKTFEAFNSANQSFGSAYAGGFDYDANGSMTARTGATAWTMGYDALGRMISANTPQSNQTYAYDYASRRITKSVSGTGGYTQHYLYNGDDIHAVYINTWSSANTLYTHGPGDDAVLMSQIAGEAARYEHADGLGSVVMQTQSAQGSYAITALQRYNAWGKIVAAPNGTISAFAFTGRERDETGFMYYRARYYLPGLEESAVGRFMQKDPLGLAAGINPYAYVGNNPTNMRDPSGMLMAPAFKNFSPWSLAARDHTVGLDLSGGLSSDYQSLAQSNATSDGATSTQGVQVACSAACPLGAVILVGGAWAASSPENAKAAGQFIAGGISGIQKAWNNPGAFGNFLIGWPIFNENAEGGDEKKTPVEILLPGGNPIGEPGTKPQIRVMPGGTKGAEELFGELTRGGEVTNNPRYDGGTQVRLPDGSFIGIRPKSRSGDTAIDVDIPSLKGKVEKIHFP